MFTLISREMRFDSDKHFGICKQIRVKILVSHNFFVSFSTPAKLERCPMCRAPINSYFCIRSEEYVPANVETRAPKSKAAVNWIDALNDRLTDFLGFR